MCFAEVTGQPEAIVFCIIFFQTKPSFLYKQTCHTFLSTLQSFGTISSHFFHSGPREAADRSAVSSLISSTAPSCGGRLAVRTAVVLALSESLDLNRASAEAVCVKQQEASFGLDLLPVCVTGGREL